MQVVDDLPSVPVVPVLSDESLPNIQGNILAPFNKPHQFFMFLNFKNSTDRARGWLAELVDEVATTSRVRLHGEKRKLDGGDPDAPLRWLGVGLTSSAIVTLHPELASDLVAYDAFWRGAFADREYQGEGRMASPALLGDSDASDPRKWSIGGPKQAPVDALLTIAADDVDRLKAAVQAEGDRAVKYGLATLGPAGEDGFAFQGQYGKSLGGVEHFGFKDGVSQPGIRHFTSPATVRNKRWESAAEPGTPLIVAGEFVLGYEREGGSYPDTRLPDPPAWMHDGSFQVFLGLRQDVHGWRTQMAELTDSLNVDMAVKAIGRNMDGTPIAPPDEAEGPNDFTYAGDPEGQETPRFAHIRKMNPRDDPVFHDRLHRLLRRGIPFGELLPEDAQADDGAARGLLFNAFMASIEDQFEFLQRRWASNPKSLPPRSDVADGPDPLVGASKDRCVLRRKGEKAADLDIQRFVWTTGAVYAFAPSIETLGKLGSGEPIEAG